MAGHAEYTIERYASIDDVDPAGWDRLGGRDEIVNSHSYLRAVEHARLAGVSHRYFEICRAGRPVAHLAACLFTFSLDVMAGNRAKRFFALFGPKGERLLEATVVECGHPTALGLSIEVQSGERFAEVLRLVDDELVRLAREAGTTLIDLRDVYASERPRFDALYRFGYRAVPNMANTYFRVYQKSFDEYVSDLVAKRRYEVLRHLRVFEASGGTVEKIVDFSPIAVELEALWINTYRHATEYQREVLNADYFRHISDYLGERSFVLACRKDGKIIGFTMFLDSGETLISTYCGLDYAQNRSMYTYFVLFYHSIETAIDLGKKWLELGVTNYSPKLEVGADPKPMFIYAKSINRLVNLVLTPILRLVNTSYVFDRRRIFNSRFYERHPAGDEIVATVAGRTYLVRDVSNEGIGLEGSGRIAGRRAVIDVHDRDGVFVRLTGRLTNSVPGEGGLNRLGFQVRPATSEYLPLWYNLVRRRTDPPEAQGG